MNINPIKTNQDYYFALSRIKDLWRAKPGTCEGNELEVLLVIVTAYENKKHPILSPSPITIRLLLSRIKALVLMDAKANTPEVKELELLVSLVELYGKKGE